jgi:hypothetical protein
VWKADQAEFLNGLKTRSSGCRKFRSFPVTMVRPWRRAVAAMWLSSTGMRRPVLSIRNKVIHGNRTFLSNLEPFHPAFHAPKQNGVSLRVEGFVELIAGRHQRTIRDKLPPVVAMKLSAASHHFARIRCRIFFSMSGRSLRRAKIRSQAFDKATDSNSPRGAAHFVRGPEINVAAMAQLGNAKVIPLRSPIQAIDHEFNSPRWLKCELSPRGNL